MQYCLSLISHDLPEKAARASSKVYAPALHSRATVEGGSGIVLAL